MKFNKVAAICKNAKRVSLFTDTGKNSDEVRAQWLGDGIGMYLLEGMPIMTPEEVLRIFDT